MVHINRREFLKLGLFVAGVWTASCAPKPVSDYVYSQHAEGAPDDGEQWMDVEIMDKDEVKKFYQSQYLRDTEINLEDSKHRSAIKSTFYHYLIDLGVQENMAKTRANNIETLPIPEGEEIQLCSMCVNIDKDGLGLRVSQSHINRINESYSFDNKEYVGGRWAKLALDIAHEAVHASPNGYRESKSVEDFGALGTIYDRHGVMGLKDAEHTTTGLVGSLLDMKVINRRTLQINEGGLSEEFMAEWAGYDTFCKLFSGIVPDSVLVEMSYYGNYEQFQTGVYNLNNPEFDWKDYFFDKGGNWKQLLEYYKNGEIHEYFKEIGQNYLNNLSRLGGSYEPLTPGNTAAVGYLAFMSFALFQEGMDDSKLPVYSLYENPINDKTIEEQGKVLHQRMVDMGINVDNE